MYRTWDAVTVMCRRDIKTKTQERYMWRDENECEWDRWIDAAWTVY